MPLLWGMGLEGDTRAGGWYKSQVSADEKREIINVCASTVDMHRVISCMLILVCTCVYLYLRVLVGTYLKFSHQITGQGETKKACGIWQPWHKGEVEKGFKPKFSLSRVLKWNPLQCSESIFLAHLVKSQPPVYKNSKQASHIIWGGYVIGAHNSIPLLSDSAIVNYICVRWTLLYPDCAPLSANAQSGFLFTIGPSVANNHRTMWSSVAHK